MLDHAQGCLLGALVGDAAGATLEFIGHKSSDLEVQQALGMCGGGVFGLAPGQITDDGELTVALARAISGSETFPVKRVASHYRAWYQSNPFDIGNATRTALSADRKSVEDCLAEAMTQRALAKNASTKANGALMRTAALGIWAAGRSLSEAIEAARADACLTHPHPSCQWSCVAYAVAVRHLLLNEGDSEGAYQEACRVVSDAVELGSDEVLTWLKDARRASLPAIFMPGKSGYVRIAFTHAFFHLLEKSSFESAMRAVLSGGGDSDTNACIVGGMVGARVGLQGIPETMWHAVRACDTTKGRVRPGWLQTSDVLELAEAIASDSPAPEVKISAAELPKNYKRFDLNLKFSASARDAIEAGSIQSDSAKFQLFFAPPLVQIRLGDACYFVALRMVQNPVDHTLEFPDAWYDPDLGGDTKFWQSVAEGRLSYLTGDYGGGNFSHPLVNGHWTRQGVVEFSGHAETLEDVEQICRQLTLAVTRMKDQVG